MSKVYTAIYENGSFRPTTPIDAELREGQSVQVTVEQNSPQDMFSQWLSVYDGLTEEEAAEIHKIIVTSEEGWIRQNAPPEEILESFTHFYDGLSSEEIDDIEKAIQTPVDFKRESS